MASDPIYTLADLKTWNFPGTALAVLGHPIKHSVSPAMHNAALAAMARTKKKYRSWKYFRFDVPPEQLAEALRRLHEAGFHGLNLTVPHKILAFKQIKETSPGALDPNALAIGAVNTLLRATDGWRGFNTDGYGLATALHTDLRVKLKGANVVLLGAGGAARAVAMQCVLDQCRSLWIGNRTKRLRVNLAANLKRANPSSVPGIHRFSLKWLLAKRRLPENSIVINATSLGLKANDLAPIDLKIIPHPACVYDTIYNPPRTALLRRAAELGLPHANGLSMLVHQGARSLAIWTKAAVPVKVMQAAARAALNQTPA